MPFWRSAIPTFQTRPGYLERTATFRTVTLRVPQARLIPVLSPVLALALLSIPAGAATDPRPPAAAPAASSPAPASGSAAPVSASSAPAASTTPAPAAGSPAAAPAAADPASRSLVLDRQRRILRLIENGQELRRFPVAVGMAGWETPVGSFRVIQKTANPIWEHPENGKRTPSGGMNPLGSRWIGFYRDCSGRKGWDGERMLDVKGCVVAGFHGTPHRWTVGHAVSHGCVRLYDEDVQALFDLVAVGTPVTVLP